MIHSFHSRNSDLFLYQESEGFLFNSDAHFLYDFVTRFNPRGAVLDIGAGCGILGLLIARDYPVSLTQIDKQPHNTLLNIQNARVNRIESRIVTGDFLTYDFDRKFDLIVTNPPYYHDGVSKSENPLLHTSRYNIHLPPRKLIARASRLLKPRGRLVLCYDPGQLQILSQAMLESHMKIEDLRFVHGTRLKSASLVMMQARKNSRAVTRTHPPLIHFEEGEMTPEVKKIYQNTRTYSIKCKTT